MHISAHNDTYTIHTQYTGLHNRVAYINFYRMYLLEIIYTFFERSGKMFMYLVCLFLCPSVYLFLNALVLVNILLMFWNIYILIKSTFEFFSFKMICIGDDVLLVKSKKLLIKPYRKAKSHASDGEISVNATQIWRANQNRRFPT